MTTYDFDTPIDRRGTACMKYDEMESMFGRSDLIPLWIADMDFAVCNEIIEACTERLKHPVYGYTAAPESYWNAIIQWQKRRNGFDIKREEMTFIPGIVKGVSFAIVSLTNPGDKIVIQTPVYHPFKRVIEQNGRVAVTNPLIANTENTHSGYNMDFDGLRTVIEKEKPSMLILCNPHNPIGIAWTPEELSLLAEICSEHGVIVVSDEIHGDIVWDTHRHTPFASVNDTAANISITFGAPSKTFNIPGFVSSWCVVKNPEIRRKFFDWLESKELNGVNITSVVATEAAYNHGEEWLSQVKGYIADNIRFVGEYLRDNIPGIKMVEPEATFLVWLDCRELGLNHSRLIDLFTNKARIALNDGGMFGKEGIGFMRMNVASPRSVLRQALTRLRDAVASCD